MRCAPRLVHPVPIGTFLFIRLFGVHGSIEKLDEDDFLHIIEKHCQQGVDYQTIHAGLLIEHLPKVKGRTGIVSRGGGILAQWMLYATVRTLSTRGLTTSARFQALRLRLLLVTRCALVASDASDAAQRRTAYPRRTDPSRLSTTCG